MSSGGTWGANQWCRVTPETTYNTYNTSGTGAFWIRLSGADSLKLQPRPNSYQIMSADALGETIQSDFGTVSIAGSIKTPAYPSQFANLLPLVADLVAVGSPATTYVKKSFTLDWFDGLRARRYKGCYLTECGLSAAADKGGFSWALGVVAREVEALTGFTRPAANLFPAELPFKLQDSAGAFRINNTVRVGYQSFGLKIGNKIAANFFESRWADLDYVGRETEFTAKVKYKANEADQAAYEGHTVQALNQIVLARTGVQTVTLGFGANCVFSNFDLSHALDNLVFADLTAMARYDSTVGGSFSWSVQNPE